MFVEIAPSTFINIGACNVVEFEFPYLKFGRGMTSPVFKVSNELVGRNLVLEVMKRYGEGRRIVYFSEFNQMVSEICMACGHQRIKSEEGEEDA